jgi:hypothetical protein
MSERCVGVRERMLDLGARRLADMDAAGIDMQILLLTTPGVQLLDTETAIASVKRCGRIPIDLQRSPPLRYRRRRRPRRSSNVR